MLSRGDTPCLGSLFKDDMECTVSNFFDLKKCLNQLSQKRVQGSVNVSPLDYKMGSHKTIIPSHPNYHNKLHDDCMKN